MGEASFTRLVLERGQPLDDLNLQRDQRLSAGLVALAAICVLLAPFRASLAIVTAAALLAEITINRRLYAFFVGHGGLAFAGAAILLHWLYYLYSGLAYLGVWTSVQLGRMTSRARERGPTAVDNDRGGG